MFQDGFAEPRFLERIAAVCHKNEVMWMYLSHFRIREGINKVRSNLVSCAAKEDRQGRPIDPLMARRNIRNQEFINMLRRTFHFAPRTNSLVKFVGEDVYPIPDCWPNVCSNSKLRLPSHIHQQRTEFYYLISHSIRDSMTKTYG